MTTVFIPGIPQQQGSKTGYVVSGRAIIADQNRAQLKPWRAQIATTMTTAWETTEPITGPVTLTAVFVLPRPKTVKRTHPHVRPDLDKLLRALLDGITDAGCVWTDDAQVVELTARKVYDLHPGVHLTIHPTT